MGGVGGLSVRVGGVVLGIGGIKAYIESRSVFCVMLEIVMGRGAECANASLLVCLSGFQSEPISVWRV